MPVESTIEQPQIEIECIQMWPQFSATWRHYAIPGTNARSATPEAWMKSTVI